MKNKLNIVYEDKDIIVINKPHNLLTIATNKEKNKTLYHYLLEYEKSKNTKIFIVHRLDKLTSGLIIFAKSYQVKQKLQKIFELGDLTRQYILLTKNKLNSNEGTIINYLKIDKFGNVFISNSKDKYAKKAITKYKFLTQTKIGYKYQITILTGRKNQIRIAFANLGSPIIGDTKYSKKNNRLYLQANYLDLSKYKPNYIFKIPDEF